MSAVDNELDNFVEQFTDEPLIKMDGYDDCVVGVVEQYGRPPILCYDKDKVIARLVEQGMENDEEALEFWAFNQLGAWVGEYTPCFVTLKS
jgi:hypothetical protein